LAISDETAATVSDPPRRRGAVKFIGREYGIIIDSNGEYLFTTSELAKSVSPGDNVSFVASSRDGLQRAEDVALLLDGRSSAQDSSGRRPTVIRELLEPQEKGPQPQVFYMGDDD
jgi:hypothetical protein